MYLPGYVIVMVIEFEFTDLSLPRSAMPLVDAFTLQHGVPQYPITIPIIDLRILRPLFTSVFYPFSHLPIVSRLLTS